MGVVKNGTKKNYCFLCFLRQREHSDGLQPSSFSLLRRAGRALQALLGTSVLCPLSSVLCPQSVHCIITLYSTLYYFTVILDPLPSTPLTAVTVSQCGTSWKK